MDSNLTEALYPELTELEIKSVLLVGDEAGLADMLKDLLEPHNFLVTVVEDGSVALREMMTMDFDVIICDFVMPHVPADMFYRAVKKTNPELAKRFLFIADRSAAPKAKAFTKDIDAQILYKPVFSEDLVRMISLVLKESEDRLAK